MTAPATFYETIKIRSITDFNYSKDTVLFGHGKLLRHIVGLIDETERGICLNVSQDILVRMGGC